MKFARTERYEPLSFSTRKEAAFRKKLQRQRDALPLFANLVAAEQPDWETEKERRQRNAASAEQNMRDLYARHWRSARAEYFALPATERAACRAEWNAWRGPLTGSNLSYIVSKYNGRRAAISERFREEQRTIRARLSAEARANQQLEIATP